MSSQTTDPPRRGVAARVGPQPGDAERAALRATNQVSLVSGDVEGTGLDELPGGLYGFTYAPALRNAPLFRAQPYRSFEVHKRIDGEAFVLGFVPGSVAEEIAAGGELEIHLFPDVEGDNNTLVAVPTSRIRQHHLRTVHTEPGLFLKLAE